MSHEHPLSYASGLCEDPLIGRTIGDDLARTVERVPGHEALVDVPTGQRWTYSELNQSVDRIASALLREGIKK
jgi:fatty-acyl-CoA synthase